jgi:hypothetical protein
MPLKIQIICICSKNAIRNNIDFLKNTAKCGIDVLKKDITFIKIYNTVKESIEYFAGKFTVTLKEGKKHFENYPKCIQNVSKSIQKYPKVSKKSESLD